MNIFQFKQLLKHAHGMDISMFDGSFLTRSIDMRMQEMDCNSLGDYYGYLEQNPMEGKILNDSLLNHFSEFFRNPLTFAVLERSILPAIIHQISTGKRKEIRIWSAGCAGGQEAYSIAILLEEQLASSNRKITYRIFATDLDETLINEARLGSFSVSALGNVSMKRLQTWFTRQGEKYLVQPEIQSHIDFSNFDLLDEGRGSPPASIFGDFDLVLCCNLLIYYQSRYRSRILDKIISSLTPGGYLVTGETEQAAVIGHHVNEVFPQSAIFRVNQNKGKLSS